MERVTGNPRATKTANAACWSVGIVTGLVLALSGETAWAQRTHLEYGCHELEGAAIVQVSGVGSSCAVIGREDNAESRAEDAVSVETYNACDDFAEPSAEFWSDLCDVICQNDGYQASMGITVCDYTVTSTENWSAGACFFGRREYARKEADVVCGCACYGYS